MVVVVVVGILVAIALVLTAAIVVVVVAAAAALTVALTAHSHHCMCWYVLVGIGKSSLMRAIAGLWSRGGGSVSRPPALDTLFLSQKPYMTIGYVAVS